MYAAYREAWSKRRNFRRSRSAVAGLLLGSLWVMFLAAGCAVGPDYVKPTVAEPDAWMEKENTNLSEQSFDYSEWWKVFEDPVLDSLVSMACRQNLPLRIAGVRIMEARAQLGVVIGNLYPQVQQGRGGITYNEASRNQANSGFADRSFWDDSLGLETAWEVDLWGKYRRAVESGSANLDAVIANYDDVVVSLTADVATTYVVIRTLEDRLTVARENVKIQNRSLEIADVRFRNGDVTELDVAQAKSLLRNTQALVPRLETSLRQAKNALSILLGVYPGEIDYLLEKPAPIPSAPPEVAIGIPAELMRRRPDIRLAERQLAAQSALIGVAKADLYPALTLFGSVGLRSSNSDLTKAGSSSLLDIFEANSIEFFAGPTFRWNIFNYGRIRNSVRVEDARFQQLLVNYENTILRAVQEVEDGVSGFLGSREEAGYLRESVDASKRAMELSLVQYREGLVSYQRVLDSQRFLTDQQDIYSSTRGSVATNLILVYRALGGGWESQVGAPVIPEQTAEQMRARTNWGKLLQPVSLEEPTPAEEQKPKLWRAPEW